jgi:hypothetical protein
MTLLEKLSNISSDCFIAYCIKEMVKQAKTEQEVVAEIKSISKENPPIMEAVLGPSLFKEIMSC